MAKRRRTEVLASSDIRPAASIGGMVLTPTADYAPAGLVNDAFEAGFIRLGPSWDPFGQFSGDLGQEWCGLWPMRSPIMRCLCRTITWARWAEVDHYRLFRQFNDGFFK